MALSPDQIKLLLAKPVRGTGTGGKTIDVSVRDHHTWFKLAHKILDKEEVDTDGCSNPACADPRENRTILVAEVNEVNMCRYCFLEGYVNDDH
jgi:hypothetical protein